jgi:2-polyprenyl-6-hydroxyphenyl methylase/3-demethylubiquinone-9 3-methyltransferase
MGPDAVSADIHRTGRERPDPAGYGWDSAKTPGSCAYLVPEVLRIVRAIGARRIADLGCGNGALCGRLAAAGLDVVGIENDPDGVRIARRTYPGIEFHQSGVECDPERLLQDLGGRRFDAVIATEVIEHLYSPHLLPRLARSLLADRGHLVLTTPYHGYLKNLAISLAGHWDAHHTALWHGGHIKFWSRRTLSRLLQQNGFEVVGFRGVGRLPWLWKSMLLVAQPARLP